MLKLGGIASNGNSVAYSVNCDLGLKRPGNGDKNIKDLKGKRKPKLQGVQLRSN